MGVILSCYFVIDYEKARLDGRKARLKCQSSTQIFVCPRLITPSWRKQLSKVAHVVFEIPAGFIAAWRVQPSRASFCWNCFPFLPFRPWQLWAASKFRTMGRRLCKVWKQGKADGRNRPCEFLLFAGSLPTLPECLVRQMLHPEDEGVTFFTYEPKEEDRFPWSKKKRDEKRFKMAGNGNNLLAHFQRELCVFLKLHLLDHSFALCVYRR